MSSTHESDGQAHIFETKTDEGYITHTVDPGGFSTYSGETTDGLTKLLINQNPETEPFAMLHGIPVDFSRSENPWMDAGFIHDLIKAQIQGGGAVIMIDHRDDYRNSPDANHYALINTTNKFNGEDMFKRNAWGIIPLPILTRLLHRGWYYDRQTDEPRYDPVIWQLPDVVEFLNGMFPNRVCIADGTFHRKDASIGNAGVVPDLSSYFAEHGVIWKDPLCQAGISPEGVQKLREAYNDPSQLLIIEGGKIRRIDTSTETPEVLTTGELVGSLTSDGDSSWQIGLTHPNAPAHGLYETLDPGIRDLNIE